MGPLINQFVYFAFFQSILLLLVYLLSKTHRKKMNPYLVFLIFVILIGLSGKVLNMSEIFGRSHRFSGLSEFSNLLFGPTIFLFVKSALNGVTFQRKDLVHYLPAVFYILCLTFYFLIPDPAVINSRVQSGELFRVVAIFVGFALAVNVTYFMLSCRQFFSFQKKLQEEISYTIQTKFFLQFLIALGLCLLIWIIFYVFALFNSMTLEINARRIIWLSIAFLMMFLAFYGLKEPELFNINPIIKSKKYLQSKLSISELDHLKVRLDNIMLDKKPYLNRKLMKADLAELLGVSNPEVARLLNEKVGMNFFEYVNYYRIKEFVALAKTGKAKELTIFGIAQEAGFNSKTTFNKSFKNLMGTTPKNYFSTHNI